MISLPTLLSYIQKNNHISYEQLHKDTCYGYVLNLKYCVPALEDLRGSISNLEMQIVGTTERRKERKTVCIAGTKFGLL